MRSTLSSLLAPLLGSLLVACGPGVPPAAPEPAPLPEPVAVAPPATTGNGSLPVATEPPPAGEPEPGELAKCADADVGKAGNTRHQCRAPRVTAAVKRQLEAYPDRERVSLHLESASGAVTQKDFATVAMLPWLTDVNVEHGGGIDSLEPLRGLRDLQEILLMGATLVNDLAPLGGLAKLRSVRMDDSGASSLEPLRNLRLLELVMFDSSRISSLEPLKGNTTLATLDVAGSRVADVRPIATMTGLTNLRLRKLNLTDLSFAAPLFALEHLDVSHNDIKSVAPLANAKRLVHLAIASTKVTDLKPISTLSDLQILDVRGASADLAPLARAPRLHTLYVTDGASKPALAALTRAKPNLKVEVLR